MKSNKKGEKFFLITGVLYAVVVFFAFSNQFYLRPFSDQGDMSLAIIIHGIIFSLWYTAFIWQATLISIGGVLKHQSMGRIWSIFAFAVFLSGMLVLYYVLEEYYNFGTRSFGISGFFWGNFLVLLSFMGFMILGYVFRTKPGLHKRFFLLASLSLLGPALGRVGRYPFMRVYENRMMNETTYIVGGTFVLIISLLVYDFIKMKKPSWATLTGLVWFFAYNAILVWFEISGWGRAAIETMRH
jgi:hypothetical protein